jgi:hypothetical protein
MAKIRGDECTFYIGTAGSAAATEVEEAVTVTPALDTGDTDTTTRSGNGFRLSSPTLIGNECQMTMFADSSDTEYESIRAAAEGRSPISIKCTRPDGSGFGGDVMVSTPGEPQEIEGYLLATFTFKATNSTANAFAFIAAGS